MCRQSVVLETLKQMKDGEIDKVNLLMFEAQVEDAKNMEIRMTTIEKKVDNLDIKVDTLGNKFDSLDEKIDLLVSHAEKNTFKENIKEIVQSKMFWVWFMLFTALAFGVSISELSTLIKGTFQL